MLNPLSTQGAQVAAAQPVGKGQRVPVWQLHLESVTLEGHGELQGRTGIREAGGALEMGQGRARWLKHRLAQGSLPSGLSLWHCPQAPFPCDLTLTSDPGLKHK